MKALHPFFFHDIIGAFQFFIRIVCNETEEGTPQGGILSPLLANIALHGMEDALNISYKKTHTTNKKGEERNAIDQLVNIVW